MEAHFNYDARSRSRLSIGATMPLVQLLIASEFSIGISRHRAATSEAVTTI